MQTQLGPTLGVRCCCKMLMVDTFLTGWGMVLDLERSSSRLAHQLPLNDGCISGPEILSPAVKGADLLSRQAVTHRKWKLHPKWSQIWEQFYETEMDLFA